MDAAYARKKAAIEEEAELGKISNSEEIADLKDALDTEWALDQDYFEKKLVAAENDAQTQEKLTDQEALAYQKYLTDKDKLDAQAVQNSQKQWDSLLQPIQRSLDTSITGIIMGTTTVQKALSNLAQSIIVGLCRLRSQKRFWRAWQSSRRKLGLEVRAEMVPATRISPVASPALARVSSAGGSRKGCSDLVGFSGLWVSVVCFRAAEFSAACSKVLGRCLALSTAVLCRRRPAAGWFHQPRWRCCTPMRWCCQLISARACRG